MKIQVSYTRKLNHELYGGNSFENSDFHAALELEVDDTEQPDWEKLQEECEQAVQQAVDREIIQFQNGIPIQDFKRWVYDYVANRAVEGQVYEAMSPYQKDIVQVIKRGKKAKQGDVIE